MLHKFSLILPVSSLKILVRSFRNDCVFSSISSNYNQVSHFLYLLRMCVLRSQKL